MATSNTPTYTGQLPEWLEKNKTYVQEAFPALPTPWQMGEQRKFVKPSGLATFVLTCLDPRCVPEAYFGPDFAGGVIRNAGGRATPDVINSITALRGVIGVKTVAVVHHTDCGMTHVQPQEIIDTVAVEGEGPKKAAEAMEYGLFGSDQIESSVREDLAVLRAAPTLTGMNIFGFKLETFTGEITPVEV